MPRYTNNQSYFEKETEKYMKSSKFIENLEALKKAIEESKKKEALKKKEKEMMKKFETIKMF